MNAEKKLAESGVIKEDDFNFDIRDVPFSRKLSFLYFSEKIVPTETGAERKQLMLSRMLNRFYVSEEMSGPDLISIRPMFDGVTVPYVCKAVPALLELNTGYGYAQFCFDNQDLIRIRGKGITLRFHAGMNPGKSGIPRLDGTFQLSYDPIGEFLFVPVKGSIDYSTEWKWKDIGSGEVVIDAMPDGSGEFELALHYHETDAERSCDYRPFMACVAEAEKDYTDWLSLYPNVPGRYEQLKKLCAYAIWICHVAPRGILKDNIILFAKDYSALSWHSAYHAMAMAENPDMAVRTMLSIFNYQDAYGELPDMVDDQYINILATKPPIQGYALLKMMERMGGGITKQHCEALYKPLVKMYQWWMTLRDTDCDGIPQYNQGCESGIDFTIMLEEGVPVECPDLLAYMILLCEALGKLAERLGRDGEAAEWFSRAKKMLDVLVRDFWNGEKFISRISTSHKIVETDTVEVYVPMMLGRRLPREIIDKMADDLADPEKYYTKIGFRSAPKQYRDGKPVPNYILGFTQIRLIPGLYEVGKKELARNVLIGFCEQNLKELPCFGYADPETPGDNIFEKIFGKCSALSSGIFLAMAGYLSEITEEA
jgi:putative isomerase